MLTYNCARVYVGGYVGGGTNENEKWLDCKYQILDGEISTKKLLPIKVKGTNSEGTIYRLQTFVLYPKTESAIVLISNGKRNYTIQLVKANNQHSSIFKLRL